MTAYALGSSRIAVSSDSSRHVGAAGRSTVTPNDRIESRKMFSIFDWVNDICSNHYVTYIAPASVSCG